MYVCRLKTGVIMESTNRKCDWFIFYKDQLLLQKSRDQYTIPHGIHPPVPVDHSLELTNTGDRYSRTASLEEPLAEDETFVWIGLRASWDCLDEASYLLAGKAYQLLYWDRHSRFCPVCGTPMEQTTPITKQCPSCRNELYPTISTAIIVLIRKGDSILLVHARNFRGTFHGLVAGFLEVGETLEECVRREVMEETGLSIRNITYFASQPWPYPSGLMVGFIADYAGGEIKLQADELSAGAFYTKDNLPELPGKLSIARRLIDWWLHE